VSKTGLTEYAVPDKSDVVITKICNKEQVCNAYTATTIRKQQAPIRILRPGPLTASDPSPADAICGDLSSKGRWCKDGCKSCDLQPKSRPPSGWSGTQFTCFTSTIYIYIAVDLQPKSRPPSGWSGTQVYLLYWYKSTNTDEKYEY
jgi:hypothetical protein